MTEGLGRWELLLIVTVRWLAYASISAHSTVRVSSVFSGESIAAAHNVGVFHVCSLV